MTRNPFHVVDVFAEKRYTGNQLAVFHEASDLSDEEMAELTRETNFSEATFIESSEMNNGGYDVRIFDPAEELPFAGHPTLGTAFVIREYIRDDRPNELTLNLGIGQIPVWVEDDESGRDRFWMQQIHPTFNDQFASETFESILGLNQSDFDDEFPIQIVSTGLPTVIVPLKSLDAVKRAETQEEPYYEQLIEPYGNMNILVFSRETYEENDLNARVFADCAGIPEDAATGSSNGCLAAFLAKYEYFGTADTDVTVEQGYEMGRPSLLQLRASKSEDGFNIRVGGRVVPIMEGRLI